MSVTIILQAPNTATITQTGAVSATIQQSGAVSATIQQIVGQGVSVQNVVPNSVTINTGGASGGGVWGEITGTITDQTDLINYLNNLDLDGEKVVEALNSLKGGVKLETYLRSESFESNSITMKGDGMRYTLPAMPEGTDYGYFMFTDTEGILRWKAFPLGFLNNNIDVDVNGGTF